MQPSSAPHRRRGGLSRGNTEAKLSLWVGAGQGDQASGHSRGHRTFSVGHGEPRRVKEAAAGSDCFPATLRSQHQGAGPWPAVPHCGGPTHRDRALGQRKRPLLWRPIGASISGGLSAAGFLALGGRAGPRPGPFRAPRSLLLAYPHPLPPETTMAREKPNIPGLTRGPPSADPRGLGSRVAQSGGPGCDRGW